MSSSKRRYRAKIVPTVLKCKTFHGYPTTSEQKYEVCEDDVAAFLPQLKSGTIPFCYNHNEDQRVGTVVNASRNPADHSLEIEYELDTSTLEGQDMDGWINAGRMSGVSLSHIWGTNTVKEVSACWNGARSGSVTYADATDPNEVRLMQHLHLNSNSGRYERRADPRNPIRVTASEEDEARATQSVLIFPLMSVHASATTPVPAAAAAQPATAPVATPAAAPMDTDEAAAPAAAAGLGVTYEFVKQKVLHGNGPWKNDEKKVLLDGMAKDALAREQAIKEAEDLRAELAAFKAKQEADKLAAVEELRKKQDAINDSHRQKMADALDGVDDNLPAKASIKASLATANKERLEELELTINSFLQIQASRPASFTVAAETRFHEWQAAQHLKQARAAQQQQHMPQQQAAHTPDAAPLKVDASAPPAVNASSRGFDIAAPRTQPRTIVADPVRASSLRRSAAMRGRGAMSEYASIDASRQTTVWKKGAGANFHHDKVIEGMSRETADAYFDVWDYSQCADGTGGRSVIKLGDYTRPDIVLAYCANEERKSQGRMHAYADGGGLSQIED